jgi:hypothetical protein
MNHTQIIEVESADWHGWNLSVPRETLLDELEHGKVLYFPNLAFVLEPGEQALLTPALADPKRKNISLQPPERVLARRSLGLSAGLSPPSLSQIGLAGLHGVLGDAATQRAVQALIARFQGGALSLIDGLFPEYRGALRPAPTSLRLRQVETRESSWRKDDSRLHVDAFPSRPNYGRRILRVFTNINPAGAPRVWRVGEPFDAVARRFLPRIKGPLPGSAQLLRALFITKSLRSEYDHLMLGLHDAMKADEGYQRDAPQLTMPFPPGSTWVCFSDQTSHAVMAGQFMLEQTLFLPAAKMAHPEHAPLGILQRLTGRRLV